MVSTKKVRTTRKEKNSSEPGHPTLAGNFKYRWADRTVKDVFKRRIHIVAGGAALRRVRRGWRASDHPFHQDESGNWHMPLLISHAPPPPWMTPSNPRSLMSRIILSDHLIPSNLIPRDPTVLFIASYTRPKIPASMTLAGGTLIASMSRLSLTRLKPRSSLEKLYIHWKNLTYYPVWLEGKNTERFFFLFFTPTLHADCDIT